MACGSGGRKELGSGEVLAGTSEGVARVALAGPREDVGKVERLWKRASMGTPRW
jgi:hypothetical protein